MPSFSREIELEPCPADVFPFFSDARNLHQLTPPWLSFEILTPTPLTMSVGTRIDYRLRMRGIPLRWTSMITAWEPPHRFVDEQITGPYRRWVHEHVFEKSGGGTVAKDRVEYAVPGGTIVDRLLVRPDLDRIFDFRHARMRALFG